MRTGYNGVRTSYIGVGTDSIVVRTGYNGVQSGYIAVQSGYNGEYGAAAEATRHANVVPSDGPYIFTVLLIFLFCFIHIC